MISKIKKISQIVGTFLLLINLSSNAYSSPENEIAEMAKNLPAGSVVPFVSSPVNKEDIPKTLEHVTYQLPLETTFLSFVSTTPSEGELERAEITEREARRKGLHVIRIEIDTQEALKANGIKEGHLKRP